MADTLKSEVPLCSTPAEYERLARRLRKTPSQHRLRLAVLASFSAQFLDSYLVVASHRSGAVVRPWFGPYNQFEQLVLDPGSSLWQEAPDVIWLALRLEDAEPDLLTGFWQRGAQHAEQQIAALSQRVLAMARRCRQQGKATIFVSNFCLPRLAGADVFGASDPKGLKHLIQAENRRLAGALAEVPDAWVLDYEGVVADSGALAWDDARMHYLARAGISSASMAALASSFCRCLAAVKRPCAKCVVVDLDNTLWGGVLGDDGVGGIKIGQDYPGNVFRDVQVFLKGLRARGFLLAIASKNHEAVALEALHSHPDMVLRPEDFSALRINWEPKVKNLRLIAETLNLGLDALVFLDDNPVERAQVRAELPEVEVPELPGEVTQWLAALQRIELLDRPRLTEEDARRAEMYAADLGRKQLQQSATSLGEFLLSLEMVAEVGLLNAQTLERVHQLVQKTNQFNLTTRRYSKAELGQMAEQAQGAVAWLRLTDQHGDLGLVCAGILRDCGEGMWEIDSLLMSCRVMGRKVEEAFLAYLGEIASARGARILRGLFTPSAKNTPVNRFYLEQGFEQENRPEQAEAQASAYLRKLDRPLLWPTVIRRLQTSL